MKTTKPLGQTMTIRFLLTALAVLLLALPATAQPGMTADNGHDIGQLWERALDTVEDAETRDAVILHEATTLRWMGDGRLATTVHRVVRINTEFGLETWADLRVPFDSKRQKLVVDTLRTWMEGRWIQARETAVVPTTPFQLAHAPAYTHLREMMILHDGVAKPSILEVVYTIEDRYPFRDGLYGQHILARHDPAVQAELRIELPADQAVEFWHAEHNGVPAPAEEKGAEVHTWTWRATSLPDEPEPATGHPAAYMPLVAYSTFPDWNLFGRIFKEPFNKAAVATDVLRDSLEILLDGARGSVERAQRITDFINRNVQLVDYSYLPATARQPRKAGDVFASACGIKLDRAVLAATLFREAGFIAWPTMVGNGYGLVEDTVPTLGELSPMSVWVSDGGGSLEGLYDAGAGRLINGHRPIFGRIIWAPGNEHAPEVRYTGSGEDHELVYDIHLRWDADQERWEGEGTFTGSGGLDPYDEMEGFGDEARTYLEQMLGGLLPGAELVNYNPRNFDRFTVEVGLDFTIPAGDRDPLGRLPLRLGAPGGGLRKALPGHVEAWHNERGTAVELPESLNQRTALRQVIELEVEYGDLDPVRIPSEWSLRNDAGNFRIHVDRDDESVALEHSFELTASRVPADQWESLRQLLLAEQHERYRTLLFE